MRLHQLAGEKFFHFLTCRIVNKSFRIHKKNTPHFCETFFLIIFVRADGLFDFHVIFFS